MDGLSFEGCRRVECVADVVAGAWLDALPVASNCVLGDGDVVASLDTCRKSRWFVNVGSPSVLGRR